MEGLKKRYVLWSAIILTAAALAVIFYFSYRPGGTVVIRSNVPLPANARVSIQIINDNVVLISWEGIPQDTDHVNIYRAKLDSDQWFLWKTIKITSPSGSEEITLGEGESAGDYKYYTQGADADDTPIWTSPPTRAIPPGGSGAPGTSGTPTSTASTPPPSPTPTPTPTSTPSTPPPPAATSTTTPPPTPTPSTPPPPPDNFEYYYTPQLMVSGTSTAQTSNFWVRHVQQSIEIGWQNIPTSTTKAVVSRSKNQTGPWSTLLTQQAPVKTSYYIIQIVDNTLHETYHYRLEAFAGTQKIATYGPVTLEPF